MTQIILTPDQLKLYHQAKEPVQVCDNEGKVLATVMPDHSAEFIAEMKRRAASPGPWFTQGDIQAMFRFLEDAEAKEGKLDEQRLRILLDEFKVGRGLYL
jgi:hypothetical protein